MRDLLGVKGLYDFLMQHHGWPLLDNSWSAQNSSYSWRDHFVSLNREFQASYLMKLSLIPLPNQIILRVGNFVFVLTNEKVW